jgi:hypothetical protein
MWLLQVKEDVVLIGVALDRSKHLSSGYMFGQDKTIRLLAWLESRKAQGTGVHARTNKKEKEGLFPKLIKTIRRDASKASPSDTPL